MKTNKLTPLKLIFLLIGVLVLMVLSSSSPDEVQIRSVIMEMTSEYES